MSQAQDDPAAVLELFVHDVANLPAEINHLMEEIQAKDKIIQECRTTINSRDTSLQKFIRLNGSLTPNPKEEQYGKAIIQNLDKSQQLQDEKIQLSEKACVLLDRHIRKLDIAIHKLQSNGMLSNDPPIPSLFNNKDQYRDPPKIFFPDFTVENSSFPSPLNGTSANANVILGATQKLNSLGRNAAALALNSPTAARSSAPATPSGTIHFQRQQRESSAGAVENKRRRLNASLGTLPAASSNLRQSSLGPGTPKAGTPASSRACSAGPRSTASTKKAVTKKVAPHQQLKKIKASGLNGKHTKRSSSASGRLKVSGTKQSPSAAGGDEDEDDSMLSSADISDSENADEGRRDEDMEDEEEDEGNEDTKVYCTCRSVSHGDMVACDNDNCEFEWFHWKCVGLTREPVGKWFCPQCSAKLQA
ncbi:putative PHD finger domain protein [Aspergillus luchuensis]|uniref:Chromatin modification-related protein n=1 Tax=Aspergillus kawachii TaxID=1069201 RepID=A0A7R7X8V8_ASPKA|nr:histone acetyltransferase complex subunit [Aspergillus luchuensis]BCS05244.1 histone acetyltransferase complex subunit [Aspergillus luchuensis]BCS16800.1 histone acetyltransferase complex subunit [Aspergillus luchuensis]GAA91155.1 PHD finger domain protein [Aspergillus luchuensis IFO 4308]